MGYPHTPKGKIGRNDPCWCHSGKKYKKCHLGREEAPKKQPWEIAAELRKERSDTKYCIHAEGSATPCDGQIIRAHTLPRRTALAAIAEAGHVYGTDTDFMSVVENHGKIKFKKIGVRDASTVTGSCGMHDDRIFAPIEKRPLIPTAEQCFLLGYRIVCLELFQKRGQVDRVKLMRDRDQGIPLHRQWAFQRFIDAYEAGASKGLAEIQRQKDLCDEILINSAYDRNQSVIIRFADAPDVLSAGGFCPEYDFHGRQMQRMSDPSPLATVSVSVLPNDGGGIAVFGWERQCDNVCVPFVESLTALPKEDISNAIVRLVFEHIENTYMRPSWWESLNAETRSALLRRANNGADPSVPRLSSCLVHDGLKYVDWRVIGIETIAP